MKYICLFCRGTDCVEMKKLPRSCKEFIEDDNEIEFMADKFLHEIKCQDCNRTFAIDKELYRNREN